MTHKELVERAAIWLRKNRRCSVVLTEVGGAEVEIPDAIGWGGGRSPNSFLVECKASRSDYLAERKKPYRQTDFADFGLGRFRWYLTPPGLVKASELPPMWGLLECHAKTIRQVVKARRFPFDSGGWNLGVRNEMLILLCELRKFQYKENGWNLYPGKATERVLNALEGM